MQKPRKNLWSRGILVSVAVHVIVALVVVVGLPPIELPKLEVEETVSVEIVPPPEPETAPEAPAPPQEAAKPEEPPPQEAAKPEEPSETPPPPEKEQAEPPAGAAPPPPPPPAPETPKQEEQAPPPPQQAPEQAETPTKPPATPDAKTPEAANPGQPLPTLQPVVQFGEKDAGPKKADDGSAATDGQSAEAEEEPKPDDAGEATDKASDKPTDDAEQGGSDQAGQETAAAEQPVGTPDVPSSEPKDDDTPAGNPVPDGIALPEVGLGPANPDTAGATKPAGEEDAVKAEIAPAPAPDEAKSTAQAQAPKKAPPLKQAKRLFSTSDSGDAQAMTAMGNTPRPVRGAQLCSSELREQLRHGSPAYRPEIVPGPRLASGNVIDVKSVGFRSSGQWYNVSFRCEVDEDVTKVTSFALQVGEPVPRSEWRRRGFPDY